MGNSEGRRKPPAAGKGRPKGALNKVTADIKALAQEHAATAVKELARIATGAANEATRVAAIKELLDRGYGKAHANLTVDGDLTLIGILEEMAKL